MILSSGLVLYPFEDVIVFPCIGSHDHTTFLPSDFINLIKSGRCFSTLFSPNLVIRVNLPSSFSGLIISINFINSSGSRDGPHFKPIGFFTPLTNSI